MKLPKPSMPQMPDIKFNMPSNRSIGLGVAAIAAVAGAFEANRRFPQIRAFLGNYLNPMNYSLVQSGIRRLGYDVKAIEGQDNAFAHSDNKGAKAESDGVKQVRFDENDSGSERVSTPTTPTTDDEMRAAVEASAFKPGGK